MLIPRLSFTIPNSCNIMRPTICLHFRREVKIRSIDNDGNHDDKPICYSKSSASKWKAENNRTPLIKRVWYTPHVVTASVAIFLIYFCIFREENDIDEMIYRPLPDTLKGIDKVYPDFNFQQKPDYILYHERKISKKDLF